LSITASAERAQKPPRGDDQQEGKSCVERLMAENWDAPIVVTTSVQMLESLFSNSPSACRKLHRLAKSVILFDEYRPSR
jgi:CRISPR-associated endonuclease/helicase Cas3